MGIGKERRTARGCSGKKTVAAISPAAVSEGCYRSRSVGARRQCDDEELAQHNTRLGRGGSTKHLVVTRLAVRSREKRCAEELHRTALRLSQTYTKTMDSMTLLTIQKAVVFLYFAASARHSGVSHPVSAPLAG